MFQRIFMPLPLLVKGRELSALFEFQLGDHVGDDKSAVKLTALY